MNYQNKVIKFTLNNMSQFDENMIEVKEQYVKIQPSEKWKYFKSIVLQNLLSAHGRLPLRHMYKNMYMGELKMNMIANVQVGYMSYPVSDQNNTFKYKVKKWT